MTSLRFPLPPSPFPPSLFLLDKSSKSLKRRIPLIRDVIEAPARLLQARRFQLPDPLPARSTAMHEPGMGEGMQMFGDRLSRHAGAVTQLRNREWSLGTKPRH